MARSGALDGALISTSRFYQTNFTKSLLFLSDGSYLGGPRGAAAPARQPVGDDERDRGTTPGRPGSGSTPSGTRCPPFSTSDNADAQIWAIMAILSIGLVCLPFIPGVRSLPRHLRVYRLIWRDYYRVAEQEGHPPPRPPPRKKEGGGGGGGTARARRGGGCSPPPGAAQNAGGGGGPPGVPRRTGARHPRPDRTSRPARAHRGREGGGRGGVQKRPGRWASRRRSK